MGRVLFLSLFFLFDLILSLDVFLMDSTCPEFFTCHVRVSVRKSVFCCHVQSVVCTENQLPSWVSSKGAFTLSSLVVSFFFVAVTTVVFVFCFLFVVGVVVVLLLLLFIVVIITFFFSILFLDL